MVLSKKIEVRISAISGRGLYAREPITKGETVSLCYRCAHAGRVPRFGITRLRSLELRAVSRAVGRCRATRRHKSVTRLTTYLLARLSVLAVLAAQLWVPDPDEKERYWFTIDQIKTWSEEEQKHFMNGAYLVAPNTYAGV